MNTIEPTIGRIVLYRNKDYGIYEQTEFPAIITRVWDSQCINLTVFVDGCSPKFENSVPYKEEIATEDQHNWRWPPILPNK